MLEEQPRMLDATGLRIYGTWDGVAGHPTNLWVFLDVQCVPNARLQILDTSSAFVLAHKVYSIQRIDHPSQQDPLDESSARPPFDFGSESLNQGRIPISLPGTPTAIQLVIAKPHSQQPGKRDATDHDTGERKEVGRSKFNERNENMNQTKVTTPGISPEGSATQMSNETASPSESQEVYNLFKDVVTAADQESAHYKPTLDNESEEASQPASGLTIPDDSTASISHPILKLEAGLLFLDCPANVPQAPYRIAIAVSINMSENTLRVRNVSNTPGWHTLIIPGLPKLKEGVSGSVLFFVPKGYLMEFSTAHLHGYSMAVKNWLCAEFIHAEYLEVSFTLVQQKKYVTLRGFTVEQETRTLRITEPSNDGCEPQKSRVIYYAMCTLRFPARSVFSEHCYVPLEIEGGPEGDFRCTINLDPQANSLPMIKIPWDGVPEIGVSRIRIMCPSRVLGMFCLTWETTVGQMQANSLPFIHAPLSEASKGMMAQLRHTLDIFGLGDTDDKSSTFTEVDWTDESLNPYRKTTGYKIRSLYSNLKQILLGLANFGVIFYCFVFAYVIYRIPEDAKPINQTEGDWISNDQELLLLQNEVTFNILQERSPLMEDINSSKEIVASECDNVGYFNFVGNSDYLDDVDNVFNGFGVDDASDILNADDADNAGDVDDITSLSFRDRIDYGLGWKGPRVQNNYIHAPIHP